VENFALLAVRGQPCSSTVMLPLRCYLCGNARHATAWGIRRRPQGITGYSEPGVLTALMGGSGAGKTTVRVLCVLRVRACVRTCVHRALGEEGFVAIGAGAGAASCVSNACRVQACFLLQFNHIALFV
jgi:hypothetical protein